MGRRTYSREFKISAVGLNSGDNITGVRTRTNGGEPTSPASDMNLTDLEITMAVASNVIASMSTIYANNMTNPLLVRDGPFMLVANSMPGGSTPNAFGALIPFDNAYTYQGGDLIFMFTRPGIASALSGDVSTTHAGAGTLYRSLISLNFHANEGSLANYMGVFEFEVVPVPEPSSFVLAALGLIGLVVWRRRGRR
jgi:hypothetical protein